MRIKIELILKNGRRRRKVGRVDKKTILKAHALGMDIEAGTINKKTGRVAALKSVQDKYPGTSYLRSHVVWWLNTGEIVDGEDIHHKNTIRIDDRFKNLEQLDHVEHAHYHNPKGLKRVLCVCQGCREEFWAEGWRITEGRGKFCSLECYHKHERSNEHRQAISAGLKRAYSEGRR